MKTLAIDVGGTKFTLAVFDGESLVLRESRATDREGGRDWMLNEIRAIAGRWKRETGFERCGIGFGGPVNFETQMVALSTHVGGWKDFSFTRWVEENLGVPAIMDNDANVGALGEAVYGSGKGFGPTVLVIDGRIYRGSDSYAGEIGHLTVRPDGPECLCGAYGCLERMCCGLWLEKDYGRPARQLLEDPEFVRRYVVNLALGIKSMIMLLNPARVVIGGGFSKAGDALFVPLRAELRKQITEWSRARIDVVPAALGDDSVLYGALALTQEIQTK
jgi:glucokinase